jgi:hypothetical protein
MGYPADVVGNCNFVTNKNIPSVIGSRVWLVTGEGTPRVYYLTGCFTPTKRSVYGEQGFMWLVEGSPRSGVRLRRKQWPVLNGEPWFKDFRRSQGNFGLGLQAIKDSRYVRGLEKALRKARHHAAVKPSR